jgi:hypothetical protein
MSRVYDISPAHKKWPVYSRHATVTWEYGRRGVVTSGRLGLAVSANNHLPDPFMIAIRANEQ